MQPILSVPEGGSVDGTRFDDVPVEPIVLSTGMRLALPVHYRDWGALMAHFPISARAVRAILPSARLRPVELVPGTAVLTLVAMEYRRIDNVEPYNEFGIMIPVRYEPSFAVPLLPLLAPARFGDSGLFVWHLPVTTQAAHDAGVEIWGYPKFVAQIEFEDLPAARRCRLRDGAGEILRLEVAALPAPERDMDLYSYTVKDKELLHTRIQAHGTIGQSRLPGGASLVLGDHPIARDLRGLHIGRQAVQRLYAPGLESLLHPAGARLPL